MGRKSRNSEDTMAENEEEGHSEIAIKKQHGL